MTPPRGTSAAASRDSHLTLRRVERQQRIVECLYRCGRRRTLGELAGELGVSRRTIARDVERLVSSGVPITVTSGPSGGAEVARHRGVNPVELELQEVAVLMASLTALGPTVSDSATSAMQKLREALA